MISVPSFSPGDTLTAANLTTLASAVIELQQKVASTGTAASSVVDNTGAFQTDLYTAFFVAEMTGVRKWKEMTLIGSAGAATTAGPVTFTDGRVCTSGSDPSAMANLTELQGIVLEVQDGPDSRYAFLPNGTFPVDLVQNGGGAGDSTHYCTYNYDCYYRGKSGNATFKIGSALSPNASLARILMATATAATKGLAYWSGSTLILELVYEKLSQTNCT